MFLGDIFTFPKVPHQGPALFPHHHPLLLAVRKQQPFPQPAPFPPALSSLSPSGSELDSDTSDWTVILAPLGPRLCGVASFELLLLPGTPLQTLFPVTPFAPSMTLAPSEAELMCRVEHGHLFPGAPPPFLTPASAGV